MDTTDVGLVSVLDYPRVKEKGGSEATYDVRNLCL